MNDSDKKRFSEIMAGLAENFSATIGAEGIRIRFQALKEYPIEAIEKSAILVLRTRTCMGMPTVAEFINAIGGGEKSVESKAEQEATKILSHLRYYGATCHPQIDDPITAYLMQTRWPYYRWAREVLESELKWWTKEFVKAYQDHQDIPALEQIEQAAGNVMQLTTGMLKAI
jgi:hypothetical protein